MYTYLYTLILVFSKSVVTNKYICIIKYSNTFDIPKYTEEVPTQIMPLIKNLKLFLVNTNYYCWIFILYKLYIYLLFIRYLFIIIYIIYNLTC